VWALAISNNLLLSSNLKTKNKIKTTHVSIHNDIFIKFSKKVYKLDNLLLAEPKVKNVFLVGEFINYGDQLNENISLSQAGQVVHLSTKKLTIRKGQSIFLSSKAILHAYNGDLIDKNFPDLFTVLFQIVLISSGAIYVARSASYKDIVLSNSPLAQNSI
jgi:hypothetical protein